MELNDQQARGLRDWTLSVVDQPRDEFGQKVYDSTLEDLMSYERKVRNEGRVPYENNTVMDQESLTRIQKYRTGEESVGDGFTEKMNRHAGNIAYLSRRFDRSTEHVVANYPAYLKAMSDMYDGATLDIAIDKDIEETTRRHSIANEIMEDAYLKGFQGADGMSSFVEFGKGRTDLPEGSGDLYMSAYEEAQTALEENDELFKDVRDYTAQIVDQSAKGQQNDTVMLFNATSRLMKIPKEQRGLAIKYMDSQIPQELKFWQNLASGLTDTLRGMAQLSPAEIGHHAEVIKRSVVEGRPLAESTILGNIEQALEPDARSAVRVAYTGLGGRLPIPFWKNLDSVETAKRYKDAEIASEFAETLEMIEQLVVSKTSPESLWGNASAKNAWRQFIYGSPRVMGQFIPMIALVGGGRATAGKIGKLPSVKGTYFSGNSYKNGIAFGHGYQSNYWLNHKEQYSTAKANGLSNQDAYFVATISAPTATTLDTIGDLFVLGKLPGMKFLRKRIGKASTSYFGNFAWATGESLGVETAVEIGQGMVGAMVQDFISIFDEEIPGVDLSSQFAEQLKTAPDIALNMLPMALMGGGNASYVTYKTKHSIFNNDAVMAFFGMNAEQIQELKDAPTMEEKEAVFQKHFDLPTALETMQRAEEAGITLEDAMDPEVIKGIEDSERIPNPIAPVVDEETGEIEGYEVESEDGETVTVKTRQEAEALVEGKDTPEIEEPLITPEEREKLKTELEEAGIELTDEDLSDQRLLELVEEIEREETPPAMRKRLQIPDTGKVVELEDQSPEVLHSSTMDVIEFLSRFDHKFEIDERDMNMLRRAKEGRWSEDKLIEVLKRYGFQEGMDKESFAENLVTLGESRSTLRKGVWEALSTIYKGATPLAPIEEFSEDFAKRMQLTPEGKAKLIEWKHATEAYEEKHNKSWKKKWDDSDAHVVEWFSDTVLGYATGKTMLGESAYPPSFLRFLEAVQTYIQHILDRAVVIMDMKDKGLMPEGMEDALKRASMVDQSTIDNYLDSVDQHQARLQEEAVEEETQVEDDTLSSFNGVSARDLTDEELSQTRNRLIEKIRANLDRVRLTSVQGLYEDFYKVLTELQNRGMKATQPKDIYDAQKAFLEKQEDAQEETFQSAFHGSPHAFDRFSLEKIGTGEGAQAYGWGLYFAGNKEVAEWYKKNLSRDRTQIYVGAELKHISGWIEHQTGTTPDEGGLDTVINNYLESNGKRSWGGIVDDMGQFEEAVDVAMTIRDNPLIQERVKEILQPYLPQPGKLYKVDLKPAEDEYLLWDKPLSEQSEKVREALAKYASAGDPLLTELFADGITSAQLGVTENSNGGQIYNTLAESIGQKNLSLALRKVGIRGIKYLDGSSRGKGEGNYNYVIFDEADIEIEETFQAVPLSEDIADFKAGWQASGLGVWLHESSSGHIVLSQVSVPPSDRKKGIGTAFMNELTAIADRHGRPIALTPDTAYGASSVGRLKKFYKRFGFVENKGANKDFGTTESMVRQPKSEPTFQAVQTDQQYMRAVNAGDMETAQKMVHEKATSLGYTPTKHATPFTFNEFKREAISDMDPDTNIKGFHVDTEADEFSPAVTGANARPKKGRVNVLNLFVRVGRSVDRRTAEKMVDEGQHEDGFPTGYDSVYFYGRAAWTPQLQEQFDRDGYITIKHPDGRVETYRQDGPGDVGIYRGGTEVNPQYAYISGVESLREALDLGGTHMIIKSPEQIKSADPVTYDDQGNVIPLSQRFDPTDPRITFSAVPDVPSEESVSKVGNPPAEFEPPKTKGGKYKGAPPWVNSPQALAKFRRLMWKLVREGNPGRFWYEDSGRAVLKMLNMNPVEAEKFIELLAIYSPQANVEVNTYFAVRAYEQFKNGVSREDFRVSSEAQDDKARSVLYDDQPWPGRKTDNFYKNIMYVFLKDLSKSEIESLKLDPEIYDAVSKPVTVDMWVYRSAGYDTETSGDQKGLGAYGFMEREINRITWQLNASRDPGSEEYLPHQVQAMLWTAIKARTEDKGVKQRTEAKSIKAGDLRKVRNAEGKLVREFKDADAQKRHMRRWRDEALALPDDEVDVEGASGAFDRFLRTMKLNTTWEALPSTATPEGRVLTDMPYQQRDAFTEESKSIIIDEAGNDELAKILGIPIAHGEKQTGGYAGGINPNVVTELYPNKPSGTYEYDAVRAYARAIQYIFRQDAVPWFRAMKPSQVSESSYFVTNEEGRPLRKFASQAEAEAYAEKMSSSERFKVIAETGRTIKIYDSREEAEAKANATKGSTIEVVPEVKRFVRGDPASYGLMITFEDQLTEQDLNEISSTLAGINEWLGYTQVSPTEIMVINFRDSETGLPGLTDEEFFQSINDSYGNQFIQQINSEGEYGPVHDWEADPSATSLLTQSPRITPDIQRRIEGWRDEAVRVAQKHSGQVGPTFEAVFDPEGYKRKTIKEVVEAKLNRRHRKLVEQYKRKAQEIRSRHRKEKLTATDAIKELEELVQAMPLPIRGKIKGFATLSKMEDKEVSIKGRTWTWTAEKQRLSYLEKRFARILNAMQAYQDDLTRQSIAKLFERRKPRMVNGKPVGKRITPEVHARLNRLFALATTPKAETEDTVEKILNSIVDEGREPTDEETMQMYELRTFGGLLHKDGRKWDTGGRDVLRAEEALVEIIETGRSKFEAQETTRKERMNKLREKSVEATTGGKEVYSEEEARAKGLSKETENWWDKLVAFDNMLQGLEWFLDKVTNDKSATLKGFLSTHFYNRTLEARKNEFTGIQQATQKVVDFLKTVYKGQSLNDIFKRLQEHEKRVKQTGVYVKKGNRLVEVQMSRAEGAKKWIESFDPSLEGSFDKMGYTDETIKQIEEFIGEDLKKIALWQLQEFYPEYHARVNKTFRKLQGVDLPYNEFYSPISREIGAKAKDDPMLKESSFFASVGSGSLKSRVSNTRPLRYTSIHQTLFNHINTMEHYIAWGDTIREMRSVLQSEEFSRGLEQYHGKSARHTLSRFIDDMATGDIQSILKVDWLDRVRTRFVKGTLGLNPTVFLKQLTSFPAFAMDIPTTAFLAGEAQFWSNPVKYARILLGSEYIQERMQKGYDRDVKDALRGASNKQLMNVIDVTDKLMFMTRMGDIGAILVGGWPVYRYHLNQQLKAGATREQAEKVAMLEFEKSTKRSQQSSSVEDLSTLQRSGSFAKLFTMFMTSPNQYYRHTIGSLRNLIKGRGSKAENLKRLVIANYVLPMIFQWAVMGFQNFWGDDKDEKERLDKMIRAGILGSFNGVLILGDFLEYFVNLFGGDEWWMAPGLPVMDMVTDLSKAVQSIVEMDKFTPEEVLEVAEELSRPVSQITGIPIDPAYKWGKAISEADLEDPEGVMKFFGFSDYALERK